MRTPFGIGLMIGAAIFLSLVALVHLPFNPRRTGRWGWLFAIVALPVLGPLLYLLFGRRADADDWDDLAAYRQQRLPPDPEPAYVAPTYHALVPDAPAAPAPPTAYDADPYQQDIDAPSLPADDGYDAAPTYDAAPLPDVTVRDAPGTRLTDDVPATPAYDDLDAPEAAHAAAPDAAPLFVPLGDADAPETLHLDARSGRFAIRPDDASAPTPDETFPTGGLDETAPADALHADVLQVDEARPGDAPDALDAGDAEPHPATPPDATPPDGTPHPSHAPDAAAPRADHLRARRRKHR